MRNRVAMIGLSAAALAGAMTLAALQSLPETAAHHGDWPQHNLDAHNTRYSPLSDINVANASSVALKWSAAVPGNPQFASTTPIVVDGTMYFNQGPKLYALDGATGAVRWTTTVEPSFNPGGRGPVYGDGVIYATGRSTIYAVNAATGKLVSSFGSEGVVNVLRSALRFKDPDKYVADFDPEELGHMLMSSPVYVNGMLYLGAARSESGISGGLVIALDARSGALKWVFRTIPQDARDDGWEIAKDTWSGTSRQGGGVWTTPAVDRELGLLFVNVSNPVPNGDGSMRKGINLFTNSIVALRLATGTLAWHYQTIHHDIWDYDLMTGPTLFDTTVDGRAVKGLASLAKTCYVYALNRETGAPLFPIVETSVPTVTDVPGEQLWPTQPIPYTARSVPQTPFCATYPRVIDSRLAERRRQLFHPFLVDEFVIVSPGFQGGPNRGPSSFSPRNGLLYVTGKNDAATRRVRPLGKPLPVTREGYEIPAAGTPAAERPQTGVLATQSIAAYRPSTGELVWVVEFPETTNGGNLVTAGDVLFQGMGRKVYALDATNGRQLAALSVVPPLSTTPLTYRAGGKQYVAFAAADRVLAFGLP